MDKLAYITNKCKNMTYDEVITFMEKEGYIVVEEEIGYSFKANTVHFIKDKTCIAFNETKHKFFLRELSRGEIERSLGNAVAKNPIETPLKISEFLAVCLFAIKNDMPIRECFTIKVESNTMLINSTVKEDILKVPGVKEYCMKFKSDKENASKYTPPKIVPMMQSTPETKIKNIIDYICKADISLQDAIDKFGSKGFLYVESSIGKFKMPRDTTPLSKDDYRLSILIGNGQTEFTGFAVFIASDIESHMIMSCGFEEFDDFSFLSHPVQFLEEYDPDNKWPVDRAAFYTVMALLLTSKDLDKIIDMFFTRLPMTDDLGGQYLRFKDKLILYVSKYKDKSNRTVLCMHGERYTIDRVVFESGISYEKFTGIYEYILQSTRVDRPEDYSLSLLESYLNTIADKVSDSTFMDFMVSTLLCLRRQDLELDVWQFVMGDYEILYDRCVLPHVTVLPNIDEFILSLNKEGVVKNEK